MTEPVVILVDGARLANWTSMSLSRKKSDMTGALQIEVFRNYTPDRPILDEVVRGKEITVYVGGHLAFTGGVDTRSGRSSKNQNGRRIVRGARSGQGSSGRGGLGGSHIDSDGYKMTINARGKTRKLIGSSHKHNKGSFLRTSTQSAIGDLVAPFGVAIDWRASPHNVEKFHLVDGGLAADELFTFANSYGHYIWEGRDGRLICSDGHGSETGEPLILGDNILVFDAEQGDVEANSEYEVKGTRAAKSAWGRDAVNRRVRLADAWAKGNARYSLQFDGDATDEALERRAIFEADTRTARSKRVKLTVFHVQSRDGRPWDIGQLHYVEIPPEGLFETLECTELLYRCDAVGTVSTTLTLTPPASKTLGARSAARRSGLMGFAPSSIDAGLGARRRAERGVFYTPGRYPDPWGPAELTLAIETADAALMPPRGLTAPRVKLPPLRLPNSLRTILE